MVGIIRITTAFILDECKESAAGGSRSWNIASDEASVMLELIGKVTSSCAMSEA
jgi:hypothetical protein